MVVIGSVGTEQDDELGMGDALEGGAVGSQGEAGSGQQNMGGGSDGGISRMSPGHVFRVVRNFSEYKKDLVRMIGFGGILEMPNLQKLNLRFSKWLLGRLDVPKQAILVDDGRYIRFYDADVEKVFGIPCGSRSIDGPDGEVNPVAIGFMRSALGLTGKDAHSLKKVEEFLCRDITKDSSSLEQDCFQVAFVIFVMGHLLAPSIKYDHVAIDYWGALRCASDIVNYNWCAYVVRGILNAAMKWQSDDMGKSSANVPGCHLFLQVFFLDNMELRRYSLRHNVFPRIKEFNSERLKHMISDCVGGSGSEEMLPLVMARTAESVCYVRSNREHAHSRGVKYENPYVGSPFSLSATRKPAASAPPKVSSATATRISIPQDEQAKQMIPHILNDIDRYQGPNGLYEFLRDKYPMLNSTTLMNALKRHNAMCVKHVVDTQRTLQQLLVKENILFAEKLISMVGVDAILCVSKNPSVSASKSAEGNTPMQSVNKSQSVSSVKSVGDLGSKPIQCVSKTPSVSAVKSVQGQGESFDSPASKESNKDGSPDNGNKRPGQSEMLPDAERSKRAAIEKTEYSTSSAIECILKDRSDIPSFDLGIDDDDVPAKRIERIAEVAKDLSKCDEFVSNSPKSPRTSIKGLNELLIGEMMAMEADHTPVRAGKILLGDLTPSVVPKRSLDPGNPAPNPFLQGRVHEKPPQEVQTSLWVWITSNHATDLDRTWISHPYPRHVEVKGKDLGMQLFGDALLEPDLCSLVIRRFSQMDKELTSGKEDLRWRHFLEPDFSTFALAGENVYELLSVQNQFIGESVTYNLMRTQMIVVPARLNDGWVCYMWDMKNKRIHILDPVNPLALENERYYVHADVTRTLHRALATCIFKYFDDWYISPEPWKRIQPTMGNMKCTELQSGIAMLFYARNYNGKELEYGLDKLSFLTSTQRLFYDMLKMEGNMAIIPNALKDLMTLDATTDV